MYMFCSASSILLGPYALLTKNAIKLLVNKCTSGLEINVYLTTATSFMVGLINTGVPVTTMEEQFRMHSHITNTISVSSTVLFCETC